MPFFFFLRLLIYKEHLTICLRGQSKGCVFDTERIKALKLCQEPEFQRTRCLSYLKHYSCLTGWLGLKYKELYTGRPLVQEICLVNGTEVCDGNSPRKLLVNEHPNKNTGDVKYSFEVP